MFVGLSTSGYQVAARLEELKELDLVQLSLDGSADVHERQRGKGSYAVALGALEALDAAGIPCWTTTVLTGENLSAIDDLLDVARRRKVGASGRCSSMARQATQKRPRTRLR